MKKLSFIMLFSLGCFLISYSHDPINSISDTINLDDVIITGTTVKVNKHNMPLAVSVITDNQIQESPESNILPVLNGRVPGLFVTERGIMGFGVATNAAGQISIRGIGGSPTTGVLMLIDGHPQFMGIFGHPLADSYIASDVERVEVIRGPGSILYGSNAMGGVINIITKKQTNEGFHGNGHVIYGSYNTQKYMASAGYKKNKLSMFASVNHDQTDGHRPNSDFSITTGYLKLNYTLNDNIQVSTDFNLTHFETTDPGPVNDFPGDSLDITRGYWSLNIDNNYNKLSGSARLFYNFGEHKISDGFHSKDANYGINIYETAKLFKGNNITIGVDYLNYGGDIENGLDTAVVDAGIYGFAQQTLFEDFTVNAGLRLQNHSVYGNVWIPAGGFAWKLDSHITWKTSVSKGFRSPTIQELFIWKHNPNLNPATIMSYETGLLQTYLNKKLNLEITGYIVKSDNMIIDVPMEGLKNAGEILNKGIEFAIDANPTENLFVNLTYSYINMKRPVYATPKHHIYLSGNYRFNKWNISASIKYVNDLDTDPTDNVKFSNYTLLNSSISYNILKYAELFVCAENILDKQYENNIYYPMPGITAFGGVKMKF